MAGSGTLPSLPPSYTPPLPTISGAPDDIILSITLLLPMIDIVKLLESNLPLSRAVILYLGGKDFRLGYRLAHAAASMSCLIALRRLHGAGCNITRGDVDGWTPLHFAAMPGTTEPFDEEEPYYPCAPLEPDVPEELDAVKTIYALCLNSHTLRAEGRETANVQLPDSFKIAHPLNLETNYNGPGMFFSSETALSIAVLHQRERVWKRLLVEGTYIKLRDVKKNQVDWAVFLRVLRRWNRFPELKHRKKGWYCMKSCTKTNDVPPWAHWTKRKAQQRRQQL
jgi:hypothetical protein